MPRDTTKEMEALKIALASHLAFSEVTATKFSLTNEPSKGEMDVIEFTHRDQMYFAHVDVRGMVMIERRGGFAGRIPVGYPISIDARNLSLEIVAMMAKEQR